MGYQSRKTNYKSQRERYKSGVRNIRIISLFFTIALLIFLFMKRHDFWPGVFSF